MIPDLPTDAAPHLNPRESHAMPGTRAPHYWLRKDGRQISTLDLFGRSFTLLAAPDGADVERKRDTRAARELGTELVALRLGQEGLEDPAGEFNAAFGLEPAGLRARETGRFRRVAGHGSRRC